MCERLESAGITCWLDERDALEGERRNDSIDDAIESSRFFVLPLTYFSSDSESVIRETTKALSCGASIIVLELSPLGLVGPLAESVGRARWIGKGGIRLDDGLEALINLIRSDAIAGDGPSAGEQLAAMRSVLGIADGRRVPATEELDAADTPEEGRQVAAAIAAMRELLLAEEAGDNAAELASGSGVIPNPAAADWDAKPAHPAAVTPGEDASSREATGYYCIWVDDVGRNKASLLAAVKDMTSLDFFDTVELVDRIPAAIMFAADCEAAEQAKRRLDAMQVTSEIIFQEKMPQEAALVCGDAEKDGADESSALGISPLNDVILERVGESSGSVIRVLRDLTGLGLIEASHRIRTLPLTVISSVDALKAHRAKLRLELAGAEVSIVPAKKS